MVSYEFSISEARKCIQYSLKRVPLLSRD